MLRSIAKTCIACAYTWTGASRVVARRANNGAPAPFIACYHRVVENFDRSVTGTIPSMLISTAMLERHIDWLAKRFTFVSLDEIGSQLESRRPFPRPAAAITFDDGYSDVFHHAYPLLKRKGIPAAVFVVTGLVGTGRPQIFDRLYLILRLLYIHGLPLTETVANALDGIGIDEAIVQRLSFAENDPFRVMTWLLSALPQSDIERALAALEGHVSFKKELLDEIAPLTWDMIKTMHRGGITIGSHTESHLLLTSESVDTIRRELLDSKLALQDQLDTTVKHFAYPDGRFNPMVVDAVNGAGYRYAYGICNSRDANRPLLTIPRKVLWERSCLNAFGRFSSAVMNCQVNWIFDKPNGCGHDHSSLEAPATVCVDSTAHKVRLPREGQYATFD
jgi:peptidoglycan/xylan/chitin deacetylase (PgdA/CDA1 family)